MPSASVTSPLPSPNGTPATVTPARWSAASALRRVERSRHAPGEVDPPGERRVHAAPGDHPGQRHAAAGELQLESAAAAVPQHAPGRHPAGADVDHGRVNRQHPLAHAERGLHAVRGDRTERHRRQRHVPSDSQVVERSRQVDRQRRLAGELGRHHVDPDPAAEQARDAGDRHASRPGRSSAAPSSPVSSRRSSAPARRPEWCSSPRRSGRRHGPTRPRPGRPPGTSPPPGCRSATAVPAPCLNAAPSHATSAFTRRGPDRPASGAPSWRRKPARSTPSAPHRDAVPPRRAPGCRAGTSPRARRPRTSPAIGWLRGRRAPGGRPPRGRRNAAPRPRRRGISHRRRRETCAA